MRLADHPDSPPLAPSEGASGGLIARAHAFQAIRRAIAAGDLVPGQHIFEVELANALGISRTPVREALRELERTGLVVSYPRRGSFIRALSAKDVEDYAGLRAAVESMAARLAVEHASRAQVRQLQDIVQEMRALEPEARGEGLYVLDLEFHEALVGLSHNEQLLEAWRRADPLLRTILSATRRRPDDAAGYIDQQVKRHTLIVEALLSGDAEAAERTVRQHALQSGLVIAENMRRAADSTPDSRRIADLALYRRHRP